MIKLNRHYIYLLLVFLFMLITTGPKLIRYLLQDTCTCYIERFEQHAEVRNNSGKYAVGTHIEYFSLPVARCKTSTLDFAVEGNYRGNYTVGDAVTVLYSASNPGSGVFLTWQSFWFRNYIIKLVLLMTLTIAVYSFIDKTQYLLIRSKRQPGERLIELTKSQKDLSTYHKLLKFRKVMFRKPQR